jgi:type 1 glutamine amidotransferase
MLLVVSLNSVYSQYEALKGKKILFTYGGWPGHHPTETKDLLVPWLESNGATVIVSDSLGIYKDSVLMNSLDLIIQTWTQGSSTQTVSRTGEILRADLDGQAGNALLSAVRRGVGFAGWHGGIGDAFRNHVNFQFMVGGQWVAHPGNTISYKVNITDPNDPITKGLPTSFDMRSEQYYMHVDPNVKVLATTRYNGDIFPWIDGAIVPQVWKKTWGDGRVFYIAPGHIISDFEGTQLEILKRGICWAVQSKYEPKEPWMSPVYPN